MSDDGIFFGIVMGALITLVIGFTAYQSNRGTLEEHELYRFCLIKSIPLEECLIPVKPYKLEARNKEVTTKATKEE